MLLHSQPKNLRLIIRQIKKTKRERAWCTRFLFQIRNKK